MTNVPADLAKGGVHRAHPPGRGAAAVWESRGLCEESVVHVHQPVADEVVGHGERPQPALLEVVRLVVVRAPHLASVLDRADRDVVRDDVLQLVSILNVDVGSHDVVQNVLADEGAVGAVHDDPPLARLLDGVAHELAARAVPRHVEVQRVLSSEAVLASLRDPGVLDDPHAAGVGHHVKTVALAVKAVPGDQHGPRQVDDLGLHPPHRGSGPGLGQSAVQPQHVALHADHREGLGLGVVLELGVGGGGSEDHAVSDAPAGLLGGVLQLNFGFSWPSVPGQEVPCPLQRPAVHVEGCTLLPRTKGALAEGLVLPAVVSDVNTGPLGGGVGLGAHLDQAVGALRDDEAGMEDGPLGRAPNQ